MSNRWSEEEINFLQDNWGTKSMKAISKNLGRSINAIKNKAGRMGLGDAVLSFEGITINQLIKELGINYYTIYNWINKFDFPFTNKIFAEKLSVKAVRLEQFWKWAEFHKHILNLSRLEPLALGPEPDWVKEKRTADQLNVTKKKKRQWTTEEDGILRGMLKAKCYTYPEISDRLQRSEAAIKRRIVDLEIDERPIYRNRNIKYSKDEEQLLMDLFHKGYGFNTIAKRLNKTANGVRGKLEAIGYKFDNGMPVKRHG